MTKPAVPATAFEPEFVAALTELFEHKIVFNTVLGLKITSLTSGTPVTARIDMKPDLVGHFASGRLHGGAAAAALDALGGLAVLAAVGACHMDESWQKRMDRFAKLGTIDLRIDYLRPAVGAYFTLSAEVLRVGSRVASTRMELHGADGKLMCAGAGAYIVS